MEDTILEIKPPEQEQDNVQQQFEQVPSYVEQNARDFVEYCDSLGIESQPD